LISSAAVLGLLFAFPILAAAQAPSRGGSKFYPDSSDTAEALLRNAGALVRDKQWSEAITIYQRVIEQFGDKVARLPRGEPGTDPTGEFVLYVDDRGFCHRALAQLPPEAREVYRNRVDGVVEPWFRQGALERDPALLRRVVNEAFCSGWGDDALDLLGDLAFQDGRFAEALATYRRLVPDHPGESLVLLHPDPSVDLARVAAKKLLCRAAEGEHPPTAADIEEYARLYPAAQGALCGRTGLYSTIVAEAIASDHLSPPSQPDSRWPTFAGSPRRTKVAPGPVDVGSKQWRVKLEEVPRARSPMGGGFAGQRGLNNMGFGAIQPPQYKLLAFHPIVLGDQVIVCDGTQILAYNLNDRPADSDEEGIQPIKHAWRYPPENGTSAPQVTRMFGGIPRYTLTAVGHRIFARIGTTPVAAQTLNGMAGRGSSSIVALDWNKEGAKIWELESTKLELPNRRADQAGGWRTVNFEGTPVGDARNVYVAVTDRREQTASYIACLDAETGTPRWVRYLGTASSEGDNFPGMGGMIGMPFGTGVPGDFHHRLISLDGPALYYLTNLGAVVALEAETGATLWVATYPRQENGRLESGSERDLDPAVIHDGRVIVAPSDSNAIFAFEAASGRSLWKSEPIADDVKLSHLLGVAQGRLVATGDRVLLFDVATGKLERTWPDSGRSMEGFGRGLLAGNSIYWPTRTDIQILDQKTGLRSEPPIKLMEAYGTAGGNLVAGDGFLVVAQADALVVFCQNSRLIERYKNEIALTPDHASNYFRLARAAEATNQVELALASYTSAREKARANETIDGVPLAGIARDHLFRLLFRLAADSRKSARWDEAIDRLDRAGRIAGSDPEKLQARLMLAEVFEESAKIKEAIEIFERILADHRLRTLAVAAADGQRTTRVDLLIGDRLAAIVRERGRDVYAPFDREAVKLFEAGRKEGDARMLDEVARLYPVALIVPRAMLESAAIHESKGRLAEAAQVYKRLSTMNVDVEMRVKAGWRLARVYEARQLYLAARDCYLDLAARYPRLELRDGDRDGTVAQLVSSELARAPYSTLAADQPQPALSVPLSRRWQSLARAGHSVKTLFAQGIAPSLEAGRVFLVEPETLRFIDPATGQPGWSVELGAPAVWVGYLADRLIAATPERIVAVDPAQGAVQWKHESARIAAGRARFDPFARDVKPPAAEPRDDPDRQAADSFSAFKLARGRLVFLRGNKELVALDGDSGAVDWSFSPAIGKVSSDLAIGADRIILEVQEPNQLLALRTDDGQPFARTKLDETEALKRPPLPIDDDSVVVVTDPRTIKRFDLAQGQLKMAWTYHTSLEAVLPVNGAPTLMGDAERLLVLYDGQTLIRLDAASGSKEWSTLLGTENLSRHPQAMAFDDRRFYCASRNTLRAISLADGGSLWSAHLGKSEEIHWSITLTRDYVIAYPSDSDGSEPAEVEKMRLVIRRRDNGALVQRLVFPAAVSDVALNVDPRGALVATSRGLWGLGYKEVRQPPFAGSTR
jgi:outer membrane protein assembly factor BamB